MIEIIERTTDYVVCLKPVGLSSQDDGMGKVLSQQLGCRVFCVHRLDTAVSGLMVYALNGKAANSLSATLGNKEYLAVIENAELAEAGTFEDLLFHDSRSNKTYPVKRMRKGVREARLSYEIIESANGLSLLKVRLYTGRTHQIRVQFATRKMPLIGDGKYGSRHNCNIALYSCHLSFRDPSTNEIREFTSWPNGQPWENFTVIRENN